MKNILHFPTVHDYNAAVAIQTLHPLVSVIDFSKGQPRKSSGDVDAISLGFYAVFLKQGQQCILRYGRNTYDYQDGTLVFLAPGQVVTVERTTQHYQPPGYALMFHPDLLPGTALGRGIKDFAFFSYEVNEALHISERERQLVLDCFAKIEYELNQNMDQHSKRLVAANIELFLGYCQRFYDRQFITRENANKGVLEKFETLLHDYFNTDKPQSQGLPSVAYCAAQLHLSANYFGDLIKKETGKSAQECIQLKLVEVAKERIFDPTKSVSEVAYELGFQYPQHFSRFFKQRVGCTPGAFRVQH